MHPNLIIPLSLCTSDQKFFLSPEALGKVRENLTHFKSKYSEVQDLGLKWDLVKMEIRGFTVKFSKIKAKKRRKDEINLQNKADELLKQSEKNPNDKRLLNDLYAIKLQLQILMRQKKQREPS